MKKKNDSVSKDMEMARALIENVNKERHKPSLWKRFNDFVGVFFLGCFLLICVLIILVLVITLIENPLSLAIICLTIFLGIAWGSR